MKRLIKFRGKRTDTGEWVFGDLIHGVGSKHGRMYILPVTHLYPKGCNELDGWEVIPDTIGQFTGRLDKNRKEIYEGDIVEVILYNQWIIGTVYCEKCPVVYQDDSFGIIYGIRKEFHRFSSFFESVCTFEIVGNVVDNPELLKGGKP